MKRLFCALLITVCVFALASCELLEKFISFDSIEANINTNPIHTAPDENASENKKPYEDKTDVTTPDKDHEQNQPNDDPNRDENNDGIPDNEQTSNQPDGNNPVAPTPNTITVSLTWQSGGAAMDTATITTEAPATLSHVYRLFAEERWGDSFSQNEVLRIDGIQINGQWVDASEVIYMNDGDYVYAVEWNAEFPSHLHVWDGGMCVICHEECPHGEWDGNTCFFCKFECWHNEWQWDMCTTCPFVCTHEVLSFENQCQKCNMYIGEEYLNIEFYEDYEETPYCRQIQARTLRSYLQAIYPEYWAQKFEAECDFYFNGTPIDGTFLITESGRIDMVHRQEP